MIQLTGAGKRYGNKLLFQDLDWLVTEQARIGLVGANGTGKSTLLKVLAGLESLDYGAIVRAKGTTSGYLPQDGLSAAGRTVFAECMSVFAGLQDMEREMESLAHSMAELDPVSREYAEVADRYQRLDSQFRARDGYALEAQAGTVLTGLGFRREDWTRACEEFSGGWQMRIALAKLLLEKPNLLLLDEPTNHLDLETRNWLEEYLRTYPHAYVLVSHDRYFLDVTVEKIAEIWNQRVQFYTGNYDGYLRQKQQMREQLEAAYRNQKERIDQLEAFINRFRYQATKAKQVQSRIKELERIERIEIPPEEKTVHFSFPQPVASGRTVAEAINISKKYFASSATSVSSALQAVGVSVFENINFVIERGDRIALVGPNGAGKSTLIKLLAGLEQPTAGEIRLGHNVQVDYFAQDQYRELNPEARVLDDIWSFAPARTQTELRNLLGCFLFTEDDVFKRIGVLSGGERNRYALSRMLLRPSNFLLLDEPTNHLDLRAKDVLLEALQEFTGTVVFVSHDRYFIDKLATKVFEAGGGEVRTYPGNYEDYLYAKQRSADLAPASPVSSAAAVASPGTEEGKVETERPRRINPQRLRQMEERCQELEEAIARTEADIAGCEQALSTFVSVEETQRQTDLLNRRRAELDSLMREWEELATALER
ncbi:MAG: ribosomal protection-like ABC-F family protein [Terriglobales bacterium]